MNTNVLNNFSAALSVAVRDSGLSKKAFAEAVGLSPSALNNYLTDRLPKIEEAMKIADFLGVPLDEMLRGKVESKALPADAAIWRERALAAEKRLQDVKEVLTSAIKKI